MEIWKKIYIGTHKNKSELLKALQEKGIQVTDSKHIWNNSNFQVSPTQKVCNLVRISVGKLGFNKPALYKDICQKAQEVGLKLCSAEIGPQLKLQYRQPRGEYLTIGMDLIENQYFQIHFGFDYDIRYLRSNVYNPSIVPFGLDDEFIFCTD